MAERVFYRGPSGTVIDTDALSKALDDLKGPRLFLGIHEDREPCRVELRPLVGDAADHEEYATPAERYGAVAELVRRALPEPAKVISHMSDDQWADFQGCKAEA
jgi:hypothetical protein